ncbi:hypothetical protein C812_00589 [Paenibacillus barengoltzii G22]|uniref:Uncharacterized protein n=1 Tax=Paenibacillus barengoltzii G22 TaxID=1235795 RepID=R9LHR2_9BACL|nr:hypothetical protein C812_00589 [Paenibacillus barengoltzii G22]
MCSTGGFTRKSSLVAKRISYVVKNVFDFSYIICRKKQKNRNVLGFSHRFWVKPFRKREYI